MTQHIHTTARPDPQVLADYDAWLHARAHQLLPGTRIADSAVDHDDLVQEGRIAMWQALASYDPAKGPLPAWLTLKAHGRMLTVLRPAPTRRAATVELTDDTLDQAWVDDPDLLHDITAAYHAGRIAQALDTLTPRQRQYVQLRFWQGMSDARMRPVFGYDPGALWRSRKNGARDKLARQLGDLRD